MSMKVAVLWNVALSSLVDADWFQRSLFIGDQLIYRKHF